MKFTLVALLLLLAAPLRAQGDSASRVMTKAVRAYQDLDFDGAARLLRRVLAPPLAAQLTDAERARALIYLGAAEHYRGRPDSAIAVFRRLVALALDQRPDTLTFPPEITRLYDGVRSAATVVAVAPPPLQAATDTLSHRPPPPPPPPRPPPPAAEPPKRVAAPFTANVAGLVSNVRPGSGASTAAGFAGSVRLRRLELQVRYAEGSNDLVEGALSLGWLATPWLSMQLGPHARRYDTPLGAERWVTWRLGARGDVALASSGVHGYALLWRALALDVNLPAGSGSAHGGEIGVRTDALLRPLWLAMAYGIDQAVVRDANRRETVKTLTLTVGVNRR
jgi:hypothetical protein